MLNLTNETKYYHLQPPNEFFSKFVKFGEALINGHNEMVAKREEDIQNAKRAEEKAKREAALAAKKVAISPGKDDSTQGVFDQFKKAQTGNADDIVNRLKNRHQAPSVSKEGGAKSELASVLARKRDAHTRTVSGSSVSPRGKKASVADFMKAKKQGCEHTF